MPTGMAMAVLATVMIAPLVLLWQEAPWAFPAGLALAAGAPLLFIVYRRRAGAAVYQHPVLISVISGLGCVSVMIYSWRSGDEYAWALYPAVAALAAWLLWQRSERNQARAASKSRRGP